MAVASDSSGTARRPGVGLRPHKGGERGGGAERRACGTPEGPFGKGHVRGREGERDGPGIPEGHLGRVRGNDRVSG